MGWKPVLPLCMRTGGRKSGPDLPQAGTALRDIDRMFSAIPGCSLSGHLHSWLSYLES